MAIRVFRIEVSNRAWTIRVRVDVHDLRVIGRERG
jgi:hypothetical protein